MNQTPIFPTPLLERVHKGMTVIDESGRQLGTVAHVRMGDPQAVMSGGEQATRTSDARVVAAPAASPGGTTAFGAAVPVATQGLEGVDLPDQLQRELLRTGFIEVDGHELKGTDRFLAGDRITDVSEDRVSVRRAIPQSTGSQLERPRSARVVPVLRTHLVAPDEARGPFGMPLVIGVGACAALAGVAAAVWLAYRRRQAERHPLYRLQRSTAALQDFVERPSTRPGRLGAALLLGLFLGRTFKSGRRQETRPTRASATVTVSLPRWPARVWARSD